MPWMNLTLMDSHYFMTPCKEFTKGIWSFPFKPFRNAYVLLKLALINDIHSSFYKFVNMQIALNMLGYTMRNHVYGD
jgi:hypothetical protein